MIYRMMLTLQDPDNLSEDRFVNTIYVHKDAAGAAIMLDAAEAFHKFYTTAATPSTLAVGTFISSTARGAGSSIKMYDMADPTPGRPVRLELPITTHASAGSTVQLPNEVAVCLTMKATPTAGIRPNSLRGRIYIGPFNDSALTAPGDDAHSRPAGVLVDSMLNAAVRLKTELAAAGWTWVVASRTLASYHEVVELSVDNAWDTQRRRGIDPTLRRTQDVTPSGISGAFSGTYTP